jgi:hypothetical protein
VQVKGLRDDTTCIVVDIIPLEKFTPTIPPQQKKQGMGVFKQMFRIKKTSESSSSLHDMEDHEPDEVEEIYEEGSACLARRYLFFALRSVLCQFSKFSVIFSLRLFYLMLKIMNQRRITCSRWFRMTG